MKSAAITTGGFSLGAIGSSNGVTAHDTCIGSEVVITGDIKAAGDVVVAGLIEGQLLSDAKVVILDGGIVKGSIQASDIVVAGTIKGDMTAIHSLTLSATAVARGDVTTQRLVIEPGASFVGRCAMPEPSQQEIAANS